MNILTVKKSVSTYLVAFSFLMFNAATITAQEEGMEKDQIEWFNSHEFEGKIMTDGKKAKDVTIKVFDGNECFSEYTTKANGKFIFTAESEKHYTIQFEKEGYVTKRIVVKTDKTKGLNHFTKDFKFDLTLDKKLEKINYSLYDFPVAIIQIDNNLNHFESVRKYHLAREREIAESIQAQKDELASKNQLANK